MLKSIVVPLSSQILMSTSRLKNVSDAVMKTLSDYDLDQRIKVPVFTRLTFSLTPTKFLHGIARVQPVLEQLDLAHTLRQQYGFWVMNDIRHLQIGNHPQLTQTISTTQKIFLILNLHLMMKKKIIVTHYSDTRIFFLSTSSKIKKT